MTSLALDAYPGTALPNPLISELTTLFDAAGVALPLTEELAADIFMGRFSDKFRLAAQLAATELRNSLYARYYDIDYDEVLAGWLGRSTSQVPTFGDLCQRNMTSGKPWSVARNGMVIERQQVITTHNLAALVFGGGVRPRQSWFDLAVLAAHQCARLIQQAQRLARPLATVKDAAYAWRQALFFLTLAGEDRAADLVAAVGGGPAGQGAMRVVLDGLTDVVANRQFDDTGGSPHGRRLLGWTMRRHWTLANRDDIEDPHQP